MYIHIPKEERTKLDPLGKKGIFVGYIDTLKSYPIHSLGFKKININRYENFVEYLAYIKSRKLPIEETKEEPEASKVKDMKIE